MRTKKIYARKYTQRINFYVSLFYEQEKIYFGAGAEPCVA